jgi:hypothetical protein
LVTFLSSVCTAISVSLVGGKDGGGLDELRFGVRSGTERSEEDVEDGAVGGGSPPHDFADVGEDSLSTSSLPGVKEDIDVEVSAIESW